MKVIIAPDSFKGSVSASEMCRIIKRGIVKVFPEAEVIEVPLADGGEGTMENLVYSSIGTIKTIDVHDPLGRKIKASYGILGDGETVIVEMAQASGLPLVKEHEKLPLKTTSYGTGELIKDAVEKGYRKFIIGLGGSATNDGGVGVLKALGMRFYNVEDEELKDGGADLINLHHIDESSLLPELSECTFTIASDVENTLCGINGASYIFGPQKGATPGMVKQLDEALHHFSEIVMKQKNTDMRSKVGGGAAGGVGAALMTFLHAKFLPGIDVIMEALEFEKQILDANLVITGEGKLDAQTLSGKVIAGVTKITRKYGIPTIALCGGVELNDSQLKQLGLQAGFSVVPGPCTLKMALENAPVWIEERTIQVMNIMSCFQKKLT
ncbi:glycerate kinase [Paenisporosarcina indica]|uniref:glycerate kinase n=1 Tax=Paenisporosarcina indica TaxID=650093 RepID=UPI00095011CF|nr:glycerate kinase [Paenisporosarcina indica]